MFLRPLSGSFYFYREYDESKKEEMRLRPLSGSFYFYKILQAVKFKMYAVSVPYRGSSYFYQVSYFCFACRFYPSSSPIGGFLFLRILKEDKEWEM